MAHTARQQQIINELDGNGKTVKPEVISKAKASSVKEGSRRYLSLPGTSIVGIPKFPFETDDKEMQKKIESSRSFAIGHVWIDEMTDRERKSAEKALSALGRDQLVRLAVALGHRDTSRLSKLDLISVCTKEGASLL